jgi:peptidyl-prolyl cis-trans isomerase B (cyclophilin B)
MLHSLLKTTSSALMLSVFAASLAYGAENPAPKASATAKGTTSASDEVAVMETTKGKMVIEFWEKDAPATVANFKKLARQGFYDGTGFHRIIKGFMIQGGDPKSKNPKAADLGTGDPGYKIKAEFNSKKHAPGVISMARGEDPNSAGSQFFLMHGAAPFLDGKYTAFGKVIEGMDVLNDIANTPVTMGNGEMSKPTEWTTLKSVKIVSRASLAKAKTAPATDKAAATTTAAETKTSEATKAAETTAAAEKKAADAGATQETAPPAASESKPDSVQGGHEGH